MGQAVIVANLKEGLYQVKLQYDWTGVDREIQQLNARAADYYARLLAALNSLVDVRRAKAEAAEGLNAVIQQWKDALIDKLNESPPALVPVTPNDPATGLPWVDPDRAQDEPLFTAINAERTAGGVSALTRNADLDQSVMNHLRSLASSGRIVHHDQGWTAADRARAAGYDYDVAVGVAQVQAFGNQTVALTVDQWLRISSDRTRILSSAYTECGVGYVYAPKSPYGYLWAMVFATPGPPLPTFTPPEKDPVQVASEEADVPLDRIKLPTIETFEPDKLGAVAAEFAKASNRVRAADAVIAGLLIEQNERARRLAELTGLKAAADIPIHAWCCRFVDDIPGGSVVSTAEVPGFYQAAGVSRTTTMGIRDDYNNTQPSLVVDYVERSINILPALSNASGKLHVVNNMTPAQTFHAAALEPGAVRWKPTWRYATITGFAGVNRCSVQLIAQPVRQPRGMSDDLILDAADQQTIADVLIDYPPCHAEVFTVGAEVLIQFDGQSRSAPRVIGFRREPLPCPGGRVSWQELSDFWF